MTPTGALPVLELSPRIVGNTLFIFLFFFHEYLFTIEPFYRNS